MKFLSLCLFIALAAIPLRAAEAPDVVPLRGLHYTAQEIVEIRQLVKTDQVAKAAAGEFMWRVKPWINLTEEETAQLLPAADALYAYGFSGDPVTDGKWPAFGEAAKPLISLDHPGAVKSPYTQAFYGDAKPGEPFYDDGQGWTRPSDGKIFYFKGMWNAWIVRRLHDALDSMAVVYMLTGDERYADRVLFLLDHFATQHSKRGPIDGSIDYPVVRKAGSGIFAYDEGHANRRMIASAVAFDLVALSPGASRPSPSNPGFTIFENIKQNYFSIFQEELANSHTSLQGQAAAVFSNKAAQGVLFGRADYLRESIDACYALLGTAIGRDGSSFETSATYGGASRRNVSYITTLLRNYSPANYPGVTGLPNPADYPKNMRMGDDPTWFKAAVIDQFNTGVISRRTQFGDAPNDRYTPGDKPFDVVTNLLTRDRISFLRLFYNQTSNPEWKQICSALYYTLPAPARRGSVATAVLLMGAGQWRDLPRPDASYSLPAAIAGKESVLTSDKRIAILRSGEGAEQRALFMRGGSNNSHSHLDQEALTLYGKGLSLTGEFGYNVHGSPAHFGYGTRPASHALVVVNEDLPAQPFSPSTPPSSIMGFYGQGPAQFIEMDNPGLWKEAGVTTYSRQSWLVDVSATDAYYVDIFRVSGGHTHDYIWNTPYVEPPRDDAFHLTGISPQPVPGVWSLAALSGANRDEPFNQHGHSWGELIEAGEDTMRGTAADGKKFPTRLWNPPPGNGYGFLFDVKAAATRDNWSATWLLHDLKHSLQLGMFNRGGQTVATAKGPSLTKERYHDVVIARRQSDNKTPLQSTFVSFAQVSSEDSPSPIKTSTWIEGFSGANAGFVFTQLDGTQDIFASLAKDAPVVKTKTISLSGGRAFVRRAPSGEIVQALLHEGTALACDDLVIRLPRTAWTGTVTGVESHAIKVDTALPAGVLLAGQVATFNSAPGASIAYAANEPFTIERIETVAGSGSVLRFEFQTPVAARVLVNKITSSGEINTLWPNELAGLRDGGNRGRVFDGHRVAPAKDLNSGTVITEYFSKNRFAVTDATVLQSDTSYEILAVQSGDRIHLPAFAQLTRNAEGNWLLRTNTDLDIRLPGTTAFHHVALADLRADGTVLLPAK